MNRREFLHRVPVFASASLLAAQWPRLLQAAPEEASRPLPLPPVVFQNAQLHNIDHQERNPDGDGFRLCRVPAGVLEKMTAMGRSRAFAAAGAELRFNLLGPEARVFLRFAESRGSVAQEWPVLAEVYQGNFLMRCTEIRASWNSLVIKPQPNEKKLVAETSPRGADTFDAALVRIALPYMPETQILRIEGDITPARPEQVPARTYLAYGSSITHGSYALRSGETYPAQVGRALGVNVINLGFGASALLEPEMADWIANREDWDFASFELGVNLLGRITVEEFAARVARFLRPFQNGHRKRPVFVIDIFTSGKDLEANPKRAEFRQVVKQAVAALNSDDIRHLDGRRLFSGTTGLCFDLLHPSADGFQEIAIRLVTEIRSARSG